MLLELSHRCPLQCPYCSNPLALERAAGELDTATWLRVLDEAAALGVLQVHFSGGEPTVRRDLPELVARAAERQLYSNLITSGVLLDRAAVGRLANAGLDHVQLSFQDVDPASADRIGGYAGGHRRKLEVAESVRAAGLPLTVNVVVHRQNLARVEQMIALALDLGAGRVEIAHTQYYGWGLVNRAALMPTRAEFDRATEIVMAERERLRGRLLIDYVVPDYHAVEPKGCMGGWGRQFLNISPAGKVLPCHAAETLPGFDWPSIRAQTLQEIWTRSEAFNRYRGTAWMPEPCRSCDRREIDWGGCRCQAFVLTGDAGHTDPVCAKSPHHGMMAALTNPAEDPAFVYRRIGTQARELAPTEPAL